MYSAFSSKAEKYDRYRWSYAPEAVEALLSIAQICRSSVIADLGAGTGILTRQLVVSPARIFAIEPNVEMGQIAALSLQHTPSCLVVRSCAEAIPLPCRSVDLITVATALHWFDPEPARAEFKRVLKPGGWLAIIGNTQRDSTPSLDFNSLMTPENGALPALPGAPANWQPFSFFFSDRQTRRLTFPITLREDWDRFLGVMVSHSRAPNEDHPLYPNFKRAARKFFDQVSVDGWLELSGETELIIGQPNI